MKRAMCPLLLTALLLLPMTRPATAGPATIVRYPDNALCSFVWGGVDVTNGSPHIVGILGSGQLTMTNNARDNRNLTCRGQVDFGAVVDVFVPDYQAVATMQLLTIEQVCMFYANACRGADSQGAVIFTPESAPGFNCNIGNDANGNAILTEFVSQRVTPSGQAQIVCHIPE